MMNILILTEFISPVQAVASIRWTKFAKYLAKEHGCTVTVMTNKKDYSRKNLNIRQYSYDKSIIQDADWYQEIFIPCGRVQGLFNRMANYSTSKSAKRNQSDKSSKFSCIKIVDEISSKLLFYIFIISDFFSGLAIAHSAAHSSLDFSKYDVLISTYGPRWPHQAASVIKRQHRSLIWIADFRDPVVRTAKSNIPLYGDFASRITRLADCVIGVSKGTIDNLFLSDSKHTAVITNGYDGEERSGKERAKTPRLQFVYTGTLYATDERVRDLSPLFISLSQLIEEKKIDARDVEVVYAGPTSSLFLQYCDSYPSVPSLCLGLLKRDEAIKLQDSASALLVCTWNTRMQKGVLTGKIFEYMRSGAPIIGFCSGSVPNSDIREIIESSQLGMCYEETEGVEGIKRIKEYILELHSQWKSNGFTSKPLASDDCVSRYSYAALSKDLYILIEGLKNEKLSQCRM